MSINNTSIIKLITIPTAITLAITLLRLIGELNNWTPFLFSKQAGGGGALLGISWLPPIFGIWFAYKLIKANETPETSSGRVILHAIGGIVLFAGGGALMAGQSPENFSPVKAFIGVLLFVAATAIQFPAWRKFFKTILAYGFAARVPVAIVMFIAIYGNWGTHYDVAPPNFPEMSWFNKYLLIGLMPQILLWIPFTVLTGSLTAGITALVMQRGKATEAAEA
ncbi:MAG: hypothetical protein AB1757_05060 [Acidobacteriota bacterium]